MLPMIWLRPSRMNSVFSIPISLHATYRDGEEIWTQSGNIHHQAIWSWIDDKSRSANWPIGSDAVHRVEPPVVRYEQVSRTEEPLNQDVEQDKEECGRDAAQRVAPGGRPKAHALKYRQRASY